MSKIYVVGTPIGNLQDMTPRAIQTLREVDFILCEDTRVTQKLLSHFEIKNKTLSFHKFSEDNKYQKIFDLLNNGKNLALVSDAGTPAISDPGAYLIKEIRENLPEVEIVTIPGPSALTAAISIAGLTSEKFVFIGFPPHKKGRKTFFEEVASYEIPVIFYESKHRILKALESLSEIVPNREIFLAKELTKLNEKYFTGTANEIIEKLKTDENLLKGEFVVIIK
jgi:16S rRNA (cytidine1402-2'-O)-methyltransferase